MRTKKLNAEILTQLAGIISPERLLLEEPLSQHTTFKVGGPAECMALPMTVAEVQAICALARDYQVPLLVIGGGSNLLVRDQGVSGIVLKLSSHCFGRIEKTAHGIRACAGAMLKDVCAFAAAHALTGIEFACGIPGSIGGAAYMNAGAYEGEMHDCITSVTVLSARGQVEECTAADAQFAYRHSVFQSNGATILAVDLKLTKARQVDIVAKIRDLTEKRESKQPLDLPSAGSTFKRPPGKFVGPMIEEAGLKGYRLGGAQVSVKHAGFVVNSGNATACDVLNLITYIQKIIKERFDVDLFPEVKIIGE